MDVGQPVRGSGQLKVQGEENGAGKWCWGGALWLLLMMMKKKGWVEVFRRYKSIE